MPQLDLTEDQIAELLTLKFVELTKELTDAKVRDIKQHLNVIAKYVVAKSGVDIVQDMIAAKEELTPPSPPIVITP